MSQTRRESSEVIAVPDRWSLVITGHWREREIGRRLEIDGELVVGREVVGFDDDRVSTRHARFEAAGDLKITDLESRNGTRVNESKVTRVARDDGDVVRIGPVVMVVERSRGAESEASDDGLVGVSLRHRRLCEHVRELAAVDRPVVIAGEPGVGKSLITERMHALSSRGGSLRVVHCEVAGEVAADAGDAVVLDRIDESSPELQDALIRFIDGRDAPILATARRSMFETTGLRRELVDRIGRLTLAVPPLRARKADVGVLARHFAGGAQIHHRLAAALSMHDWPGNLRELAAVIDRAVLVSGGDALRLDGELASMLGFALERTSKPDALLEVKADGSWFAAPGHQPADLSERPTLARILEALVRFHRVSAISVADLLEAGWPGEQVLPSAGANRVYVALAALRKLGLRDWLARDADGYRIPDDHRVKVR